MMMNINKKKKRKKQTGSWWRKEGSRKEDRQIDEYIVCSRRWFTPPWATTATYSLWLLWLLCSVLLLLLWLRFEVAFLAEKWNSFAIYLSIYLSRSEVHEDETNRTALWATLWWLINWLMDIGWLDDWMIGWLDDWMIGWWLIYLFVFQFLHTLRTSTLETVVIKQDRLSQMDRQAGVEVRESEFAASGDISDSAEGEGGGVVGPIHRRVGCTRVIVERRHHIQS